MKKEDIKLKSIKTFQGRDVYGLSADIFIGKVKVAHVFDAANGGMYNYTAYDREKLRELETYAKSLPDFAYTIDNGEKIMLKMDLDMLVSNLANEIEKSKAEKKMKKQMNKGILFGIPGGNSYRVSGWKIPLKDVIERHGSAMVQALINKIEREELKTGEDILNTNLEDLGLTK